MSTRESINCALNLMKKDLRGVIKKAKESYKCNEHLYPGDYGIFDYFKKEFYHFLNVKGCDLTRINFHFSSGSSLDDTTIVPDNLYTLVCINGYYPKAFSSNIQTYSTPLADFLWKSSSTYRISIRYEILLNVMSLFNSISDQGVVYNKSSLINHKPE